MADAGPGCGCPTDHASIFSVAKCVSQTSAMAAQPCNWQASSASQVILASFECVRNDVVSMRGFFVVSRDKSGAPVCSVGDAFHLSVVEKDGGWRFAALSQAVSPALPHMSWLNTSAAQMPGEHEYELTLSLVETTLRSLQRAENRAGRLHISAHDEELPLIDWLRDRQCVWQRVPLPLAHRTIKLNMPTPSASTAPLCTAVPPASSLAYRRVSPRCETPAPTCERVNQTWTHVLDTSNSARLRRRQSVGYEHELVSSECNFRWFGEVALTRCLAGRSLLNVGHDAVDVQRGLARINRSLHAWTQVRPGPQHPNAADFHRAFERHWQQCFFAKRGSCDVRFGGSRIRTLLKRGLPELLPDTGAGLHTPPRQAHRRRLAAGVDVLTLMCEHDIVVFESGTSDMSLPTTRYVPLREANVLIATCGNGRPAAECAAVLPAALKNETWRQMPLSTYRRRLVALMQVWKECRSSKGPAWRGIFKLAGAPRARAIHPTQEPADCELAQAGYSSQAHHMATANEVAKRIVEQAGFEVFDPFAATLHASPSWFDALPATAVRARRSKGLAFEIHSAEAVSDMMTQMLLNQLCANQRE